MSSTSCWDPVHPWGAALCRSTSPWDAHSCCLPITLLGISHVGIQGCRESLKESALSKMHAVVVCSRQSLQNQNSQACWSM